MDISFFFLKVEWMLLIDIEMYIVEKHFLVE